MSEMRESITNIQRGGVALENSRARHFTHSHPPLSSLVVMMSFKTTSIIILGYSLPLKLCGAWTIGECGMLC